MMIWAVPMTICSDIGVMKVVAHGHRLILDKPDFCIPVGSGNLFLRYTIV